MDDKTALDLLSSDFSDAPKPAVPVVSSAATTKLEPPVLDSEPLKVAQKMNYKTTLKSKCLQWKKTFNFAVWCPLLLLMLFLQCTSQRSLQKFNQLVFHTPVLPSLVFLLIHFLDTTFTNTGVLEQQCFTNELPIESCTLDIYLCRIVWESNLNYCRLLHINSLWADNVWYVCLSLIYLYSFLANGWSCLRLPGRHPAPRRLRGQI